VDTYHLVIDDAFERCYQPVFVASLMTHGDERFNFHQLTL